jgi:hypothetical protein
MSLLTKKRVEVLINISRQHRASTNFIILSHSSRNALKNEKISLKNVVNEHQTSSTEKCWILLTDEEMNCYCCLSKMNEKFSSLYRKSFSFIYLLIFIFWFIEIHLRIEIFVCHENFFFWSSHLRSSLSLRFDFIRIAYSSSNSLISRRSRKSINLKEIISIEWL